MHKLCKVVQLFALFLRKKVIFIKNIFAEKSVLDL